MEILVRLAVDKYYKNKVCESFPECISKFFTEDGVEEAFDALPQEQNWREE